LYTHVFNELCPAKAEYYAGCADGSIILALLQSRIYVENLKSTPASAKRFYNINLFKVTGFYPQPAKIGGTA